MMNSLSFQRLKDQLKDSFDLIVPNPVVFGWRERQFRSLTKKNPILSTLLMELEEKHRNVVDQTKEILNQPNIDVNATFYNDIDKQAASSLTVVKHCLAKQKPWHPGIELRIGVALPQQPKTRHTRWLFSLPYTYIPSITISTPDLKRARC